MMNLHPLSFWSFIVVVLSVVSIVVLTIVNKHVPTELTTVLYVSLGTSGASGLVPKAV